jgi:hypothetical protein
LSSIFHSRIFLPSGFYLFLQVQFPLSLVSIKYKHFLMFGCGKEGIICLFSTTLSIFTSGGPVLNMAIWICLRILTYDQNLQDDLIKGCPFIEKNEVDFFVCEVPIFLILLCNTFFLIWIMMASAHSLENYEGDLFHFPDCCFQASEKHRHGS